MTLLLFGIISEEKVHKQAGEPPGAISHRVQLASRQGQFRIVFSELGFAELDVGKCWTNSLRKNAQQWDS
jgi:hypothetical protein